MNYVVGIGRLGLAVLVAAGVAACGGGGGGSPSLPIIPITPPAPAGPTASDLIVTLDKVNLTNSGSDAATLTVTAVDSSRNVVASAPVTVAVENNGVFTPDATGGVTGANGAFVGKILIGSDKSDRLIPYTIKSGSITKTGNVTVSGIALSATAVPAAPAPGQSVTLTTSVKDVSGNAVSGVPVTLSGLPGVPTAPAQTNNAGLASFTFNAPAAEGTYPVNIAGAGTTASYDLKVLTPGSTTVPVAIGPISGASAIATPVVVGVNTAGSIAKQSEVRALFVAADNKPISNVRVRFSVISSALPGESLSNGSAIVYSDNTGVAKISYIAPTTASPNEGVVIRACYSESDFAAADCPKSVTARLTVAAAPVSLTIGVDNVIEKSASGISYVKKFEIQAVDAAGNYAKDVPLSAVISIENYRKAPAYNAAGIWCPNEDTNRNGVLDQLPVNEDTNGDGTLTPRQSDVAIGFVGDAKTNASGLALLQLQYPQNVATWLNVKIKVNAGVSGSEGEATYSYVLSFAEDDEENGSFRGPLYGSDTMIGTDPTLFAGCKTAR